jgi:aspartate/methionine/tyrosine aminotransferase
MVLKAKSKALGFDWKDENWRVWRMNQKRYEEDSSEKLQRGSYVLIRLPKNPLGKGYDLQTSKQLYQIQRYNRSKREFEPTLTKIVFLDQV